MNDAEEQVDKQHEPTQKKLDDARQKGDVAKSNDLMTAASYLGLLTTILAFGAYSVSSTGTVFANLIDRASEHSESWFSDSGGAYSFALVWNLAPALSGWFVVPALFVLAVIVAQRAFVFAPSKIEPKLSRISLVSNAKNKFGRSGLFEFFKSFLKLLIYSGALGGFLFFKLDDMISVVSFGHVAVLLLFARITLEFLSIVLVIALAIGGLDLIFQHSDHKRKNRMSHKELTDEAKQAEGDPHMKQQRRQKGYEIASNAMLQDVPDASVVIVNPTHYAVALKWQGASGKAPECVAKGVDEMAAKIREIAVENAIPIHSDPATARALFASIEVGEEVRSEHYKPVAVAIRFAEAMRQRAKALKF